MTINQVLDVSRDLFYTALLLAMPSLVASLIIGLVISILQTITSIQDQTLSYAPRLIGVAMAIVFTMAWSLQLGIHFTVRMMQLTAEVTR